MNRYIPKPEDRRINRKRYTRYKFPETLYSSMLLNQREIRKEKITDNPLAPYIETIYIGKYDNAAFTLFSYCSKYNGTTSYKAILKYGLEVKTYSTHVGDKNKSILTIDTITAI